jgi:hypothetical protein
MTRMPRPAREAASAVRPTDATSGSVKVTWGTTSWSAEATCLPQARSSTGRPAARAAIAPPAARGWFLPWWVSRARWFTAPAAYSQSKPVSRRVSSTWSQSPGPSPIVSSPRSRVRGTRPVATSTCSAVTALPSESSSAASPSRDAAVTSTPVRMSTPAASRAARTASPANGSMPWRIPSPRTSRVTRVPKLAYAVAISHPTTPPPRMARLAGAAVALVASRLVQGAMPASPGMSGTIGSLPVLIATAWRAVSSEDVPSGASTRTVRSPAMRPRPRTRSMPVDASHSTCEESSQSWVSTVRRAKAPAGSSAPVTACLAPSTARAARSACPGRSRPLEGMQAQYEHSPPTSSCSTTTTLRPPFVA